MDDGKKYDDTDRGVLFRAEKKTDKHPDYKGDLNVGGVEFWLSGWAETSKAGVKYMQLRVTKKEPPAEGGGGKNTGNDDLPF